MVIVGLLAGYAIGNLAPFPGFSFFEKSIEGDTKLEVRLVLDNGAPLSRVEVDIGEKIGPPAKGGVAVTDENGVATFNIRSGDYVVFFNTISFPKNLVIPKDGVNVQVQDDRVNQKTIVLKTK
jgi:hypothetical protein